MPKAKTSVSLQVQVPSYHMVRGMCYFVDNNSSIEMRPSQAHHSFYSLRNGDIFFTHVCCANVSADNAASGIHEVMCS